MLHAMKETLNHIIDIFFDIFSNETIFICKWKRLSMFVAYRPWSFLQIRSFQKKTYFDCFETNFPPNIKDENPIHVYFETQI
jgi:hypothetical protein